MEKQNKIKYISEMLNKRTKGKAYENFVINQIYARLDNPELEVVTQKCVKIDRESISATKNLTMIRGNYCLIDLYFPQINFAVEVDEGHHENIKNKISDKNRENFIKDAVSCKIERIKICKDGTTSPKDYESILNQIKHVVKKINQEISKKSPLKWITNEDKIEQVKQRKSFKVSEDIHFGGIKKILATFFKIKSNQHCLKKFKYYSIWVPELSVKLNNGTIKTANGYKNFINEDWTEIFEFPSDTKNNKKWGSNNRVVFMKMKDEFGKNNCRFVGVFKEDHIEYKNGELKRVYKRIGTEISFADIAQK